MQKKFRYLFLITFILGCLAIVGYFIFLVYKFSNLEGVNFIDAYKRGFAKSLIYIPNGLAFLGFIIATINIRGLIQNKPWANILTIILCIISMLVIVGLFFFIKHEEGRYLLHSKYFKLYLMAAIPMTITIILALISFIKRSAKQPI